MLDYIYVPAAHLRGKPWCVPCGLQDGESSDGSWDAERKSQMMQAAEGLECWGDGPVGLAGGDPGPTPVSQVVM